MLLQRKLLIFEVDSQAKGCIVEFSKSYLVKPTVAQCSVIGLLIFLATEHVQVDDVINLFFIYDVIIKTK